MTTPEKEKARLAALRSLGVLDTQPDPELDAITVMAAERFDVPIALISLVDDDRQWFKSCVGLDVRQTDRSVAFCGYTIQSDEVFVVLDARADERFRDNPLVTGQPGIRFYAGAPLILSGGERVGSLCLIDRKPWKKFPTRAAEWLKIATKQVVAHLEMRKLRAAQNLSQLIADTTPDAFVCAGPDGRIIYWNRGAEQTFGFSEHEALGYSLDIIVPPEHLGAHMAGIRRLNAGGTPRLVGKTIEVPAVRKDGTRLMTELTLGMWGDAEKGMPIGFAAIMRDVSQRKVTEGRLADQVAAIEAAREGIAIAETDGICNYMNEAFLVMFGLPPNSTDIPWSHLVAAHERERVAGGLFWQLSDGGNWSGEVNGLKADGTILDLEVSFTRRDKAVVCVVRDISSRREAAREMARLREQLVAAQRQEAVGQLASGLAHDFNNLIAAISGSAALLSAGQDAEARRHGARIEAAARDAASLVDKMLSLGKRNPHYEMHDARTIGRDVSDLLRTSLAKGQSLRLDLDAEPVMVTADRTELMQVLLNLGLNARDALYDGADARIILGIERMAEAPAQVQLALGSMPKGPLAHFFVSDTGCGIAADEQHEIFRPFYTRKEGSGTGLGLAMVADIVSAIGGGLSVRSTIGNGARFDIYWPLEPPLDLSPPLQMLDTSIDGALRGVTVLLVDDEPAIVETLSEMLERVGAEVGSCIDPRDALAALEDDPDAWDLLVTDYDMPGLDGSELALAARKIRNDLPILLVTALPDAHRARAQEGELFDVVSGKLVSVPGLVTAAQAAISHRRSKLQ